MRLIDADALIEKWYEVNNIGPEDRGAIFIGYTEIPRFINNAPTVQPTGDLISRADAIEAVAQQWLFEASVGNPYVNDDDIGEYRKLAEELFEDVPSADAEWIPCSENLPSDDDWVIVSIDYDRKAHGDNTVYWQNVTIAFYDGTWRSIESIGGESWVTAWMPLPKPYKGGAE